MFSQSFTQLVNQNNVIVRVVFSIKKNQAKSTSYHPHFLLLFEGLACFVAF
jgi:hypothetical protein